VPVQTNLKAAESAHQFAVSSALRVGDWSVNRRPNLLYSCDNLGSSSTRPVAGKVWATATQFCGLKSYETASTAAPIYAVSTKSAARTVLFEPKGKVLPDRWPATTPPFPPFNPGTRV